MLKFRYKSHSYLLSSSFIVSPNPLIPLIVTDISTTDNQYDHPFHPFKRDFCPFLTTFCAVWWFYNKHLCSFINSFLKQLSYAALKTLNEKNSKHAFPPQNENTLRPSNHRPFQSKQSLIALRDFRSHLDDLPRRIQTNIEVWCDLRRRYRLRGWPLQYYALCKQTGEVTLCRSPDCVTERVQIRVDE